MNKYFLVGIFALLFFAGVGFIMVEQSITFGELMRSMRNLNPRLLGFIALPFIALLFVLGVFLHRKNQERKWKQALLKTRAKRQSQQTSAPE